jgi:hypothetical protein
MIASTLAALLLIGAAPPARADFYVVVGEHSPVTTLSQKEVMHLFMGRSRSFPDGSPATPHDLAQDAQREGFYRSLSGLTLPQVTSYWARLMFSGRNLPPARVETEADMVERLRTDATAIGWLPAAPKDGGIRTVLQLRAAP